MATANADITRYDSGSVADQEARVRRDERIRVLAERDRVMRELQGLRGATTTELRTLQAFGKPDAATTAVIARLQAPIIALERQLQQLEQALAAAGPETPALTEQDAFMEPGAVPSVGAEEDSPQRTTTDIRRPARQLAGQASFSQAPPPQGAAGAAPQMLRQGGGSPGSGNAAEPGLATQLLAEDVSVENTAKLATNLRQRLDQKAARNRTEKQSDAKSLAGLQAARPPNVLAWAAVTLAALCVDAIDILLHTIGDAAGGVGTAISIFVNIAMFLTIRAMMNRGVLTAWALGSCLAIGILVTLIGTLLGPLSLITSLISIPLFSIVAVAGIFNPNASEVPDGKEEVEDAIKRMNKSITVARQTTAQALRFARRAGKSSKTIAKLTRSLVRNKAFRTVAKYTKTGLRWLRRIGPQIANSAGPIGLFPWQLLTVAMTYRSLKQEHAEAQVLLARYAQTAKEEAEAIPQAELARYESQAGAVQAASEAAAQEAVAARPPSAPVPPPAPTRAAPPRVSDITRPGSPVAPVRRPEPRSAPLAVPMRDIAAAA